MENVKKFNLPKYKIFENKIENFLYFAETSCIWLKIRYNKKQKNHSGCNGSAGTSQITAYILTDFFSQMYCCHFIVMQHSRCGNHTNSRILKIRLLLWTEIFQKPTGCFQKSAKGGKKRKYITQYKGILCKSMMICTEEREFPVKGSKFPSHAWPGGVFPKYEKNIKRMIL